MLQEFADRMDPPRMRLVRVENPQPPALEPAAALTPELGRLVAQASLPSGARVAVCVGSRGIARLPQVVAMVVAALKDAGLAPFVTPAMGSHGGATAAGQIAVLERLGVTAQAVGAPLEAGMETDLVGTDPSGLELHRDRLVGQADGYILINRIKSHTNFIGPTESGILKMAAIGLGNQTGAEYCHRMTMVRGQYETLSRVGRGILAQGGCLGAVGLVENAHHELCRAEVMPPERIEAMETELLTLAKSLMPRLPVDRADLLIVDEMGKDISGTGMDPNVIGRDCCAYGAPRTEPTIARIYVRGLTKKTAGAAVGIGLAEFTLQKVVDLVDREMTAMNCLTACCPEAARLPMALPNDREALAAAFMTLRPSPDPELEIVHIKNTMELDTVAVSEALWPLVEQNPRASWASVPYRFQFDAQGMLVPPAA